MQKSIAAALAGLLAACSSGTKTAVATGSIRGSTSIRGTSHAPPLTVTLSGPAGGSTTTTSSGGFSFSGLPDGRYVISASAPSTKEGLLSAEVVVAGAEADAGDLSFTGVGTVTGRVVLASVEGGFAGTLVSVAGSDSVSTTDASGTYVLQGLRPGRYVVQAFHDGYTGQTSDSVEVRYGEIATVADLSLPYGPQSGTASIAGVAHLDGAALPAGTSVSLVGPRSATAATDASGAYAFTRLPAGRYLVGLALPSTAEGSRFAAVALQAAQAAVAPDLRLTAVGSLAGLATAGGVAQEGTLVTLAGSQLATTTDAAGAWSLQSVPAGAWTVRATRPGFAPATSAVAVTWAARTTSAALDLVGVAPAGVPESTLSSFGADRTAGVVADGADRAQLTVRLRDAAGRPLPGVAVTLVASDPSVQLAQPGATDSSGTATAAVSSRRAGPITLRAVAAGPAGAVTLATQLTLVFTAGPAARLAFVGEPASVAAGATWPVAVQVQDRSGNPVAAATNVVQVSLFTAPAAAALLGTRKLAASAGVAQFADLRLVAAASGYTLVAAAAGLDPAVSVAFDVSPGPAAKLGFIAPPATATAGTTLADAAAQPLVVAVQDQFGNTADGAPVQVAVALAGNAAALQGTLSAATSAGAASFGSLRIDLAGKAYVLTASAAGFSQVSSAPFDVKAAAPAAVAFVKQPQSGSAVDAHLATVAVVLKDAFGNTAPADAAQVALALRGGPATAAFDGGASSVITSLGREFQALVLHTAGQGYTLVATAPDLAAATSAPFDVAAGPYSALGFIDQPPDVQAGQVFAVTVATVDAYGNFVSAGQSGRVQLGGPISGRGFLNNGVAHFANLALTTAGSFTLSATLFGSSGAISGVSRTFEVSAGPASTLSFPQGIDQGRAGQALTSGGGPVQVAVTDSYGNAVTSGEVAITVSLGANPTGDALHGTATRSAVGGVASFGDLKLDKSAPNYSLFANAATLSQAEQGFAVDPGPAATLGFGVAPVNTRAASLFPAPVSIELHDAYGNAALASDPAAAQALSSLSVALSGGAASARLSGLTSPSADPTLARVSFPALQIDKAGTGYQLSVSTAASFPAVTSDAFNVTAAAWSASTGIEGGSVSALARDPASTSAFWAGVGSNIFHSSDGGVSWRFVTAYPGKSVLSIAADPNAPAKVYALIESGAIYQTTTTLVRSLDGGASWTVVPVPLINSQVSYYGYWGHSLVFSSASSPSELYVAFKWTGLQRTTDDGATFSTVYSNDVWAVAAHPTDPNTLFLSDANLVKRSTDRGATWANALFNLANNGGMATALAFDPATPNVLLCGTTNGVYVTTSATASQATQVGWVAASTPSGFYRLAASSRTPGLIYALSGQYAPGVLYRSADHGQTWSAGAPVGGGQALSLALDASTDAVLVGDGSVGVLRSTDGAQFSRSTSGLAAAAIVALAQDPTRPLTYYAATAGNIYRSQDGGQTFAPFSEGLAGFPISAVAVAPDGSYVYASNNVEYHARFARRAPGDAAWSLSGSLYGGVTRFAFDAVNPALLYAYNGVYGHFFKSLDRGASFTDVTSLGDAAVLTDPKVAGRIYYFSNQLTVSSDYGASFLPTGGAFDNEPTAGALSPADTTVLYAAVDGHVYRSADSAATFVLRTDLPAAVTAFSPSRTDANSLFGASGPFGGLYSTADGAQSWTYAGSGLASAGAIRTIVRDVSAASTVLVATDSGVFRTTTGGQ